MPRKPFFRNFDRWWYAQLNQNGKRTQVKLIKGKENEEEAYRRFCRLMAEEAADGHAAIPARLTTLTLCDLFLEFSSKLHAQDTYLWYRYFLQSFCDHCGKLEAQDVRPFHVNRWVDQHEGWTDGGRRSAITCVKRAFNWAEGEGLLKSSPLKKLKKPPAHRRERILTAQEWEELFAAVRDQEFKDFLIALRETGCRPGEVRKVTAENVNLGLSIWILPQHKTRKKTGLPRIVYLTPRMVDLCREHIARFPKGPIFRGPIRPFSKNGIRCRFMRLRKKLPHLKGVISYTLRHSFANDALEKGIPAATVAELMGHKDVRMLMEHYSHLSEKRKHLLDAAQKAAGGEGSQVPA